MNISLSPEAEAFVRARVERGDYESMDAIVEEGLALVRARDRALADLKASVADSLADIDAGHGIEVDDVAAYLRRKSSRLKNTREQNTGNRKA